jgi:transcriptional regulator with XRE-family HTH domain
LDEAGRRARAHLGTIVDELRQARRRAGLSQRSVAHALGVSRALVGAWEASTVQPGVIHLYRWGAIVGLDVSIRAFPGGSPLRDAGQLRLLARFRLIVERVWTCRTEAPVSADPRDRRAFDMVLLRGDRRVAAEAITRLVDAQAQIRSIELKAQASGVNRVVLVMSDGRHSRAAVDAGRATIEPAFPCPARAALSALRVGELPPGNAVVFV